jgi:hypothetical protein
VENEGRVVATSGKMIFISIIITPTLEWMAKVVRSNPQPTRIQVCSKFANADTANKGDRLNGDQSYA